MRRALAGLAAALAAAPALAQAPARDPQTPAPDPPTVVEVPPQLPPPPDPVTELAYDSRIRASAASAQSFQGPLDGAWTLSAEGVGALYAFQLVDRGAGPVEGAWRDVRRPGALEASGFVDQVERGDGAVTLRFAGAKVATLRAGPDGGWTGELVDGGARRTVRLSRRAP